MNKSIVTINWNSRAEVLLWPNCKQAWTQWRECKSQEFHQMKILPNWNELNIENGAGYISHLTQSISQLLFKSKETNIDWICMNERETKRRNFFVVMNSGNVWNAVHQIQSYSTFETCWVLTKRSSYNLYFMCAGIFCSRILKAGGGEC